MKNPPLTIHRAALLAGVSEQTLRRWDQDGTLPATRSRKESHRRYDVLMFDHALENGKLNMEKMACAWIKSREPFEPLETVYCSTSATFQIRLQRVERQFQQIVGMETIFPLLTSSAGEIGNNSFDHNLGNWPDVPGIFFGHDLRARRIVLCDRGIGILASLRRVRPSIQTHVEALRVAFHEIVTGRASEHRGNGLKFVRGIIASHPSFGLRYQTGDAILEMPGAGRPLTISRARTSERGCLAVISY